MTDQPKPAPVEPTGDPSVDALIDVLVCPTCRTIFNAAKAQCADPWHYDNGPAEPVSSTPADAHPERVCARCGGPNITWSAPSPLWNAVMRGGSINGVDELDGIVCPVCFAHLAEERGIAQLWRLSSQAVLVALETVTPSGRVWDDEAWLWREPLAQGGIVPPDAQPQIEDGGDYLPRFTASHDAEIARAARADGFRLGRAAGAEDIKERERAAYERGKAEGIAEGKRQAVAIIEDESETDGELYRWLILGEETGGSSDAS